MNISLSQIEFPNNTTSSLFSKLINARHRDSCRFDWAVVAREVSRRADFAWRIRTVDRIRILIILFKLNDETLPCTTDKSTAARWVHQRKLPTRQSKAERHRVWELDPVWLWRRLRASSVCRWSAHRRMEVLWFDRWPMLKVSLPFRRLQAFENKFYRRFCITLNH